LLTSPGIADSLAFGSFVCSAIRPDQKITKKGFIAQNRGIESGRDMDEEFIGAIFGELFSY